MDIEIVNKLIDFEYLVILQHCKIKCLFYYCNFHNNDDLSKFDAFFNVILTPLTGFDILSNFDIPFQFLRLLSISSTPFTKSDANFIMTPIFKPFSNQVPFLALLPKVTFLVFANS